ncbi:MAG TPA: hypothetical protein VMF06_19765 [Candidatus Limnocylindria bacterium]|nr:hypothetical protein [Candidatus Limnocylindria bacterium]
MPLYYSLLISFFFLLSTIVHAAPKVSAPPESFFKLVDEPDREIARAFYKKYIDVAGMPVVAADPVADQALERTYDIVTHLLAGRPDIIQSMVANGMYLIIIGKDQVYTDMPEYRHSRNPAYMNERVRGTGGKPTSFGEENLLSLPIDRYDDESIGVHEFCHTIDGTLESLDPTWGDRLHKAYKSTLAKGLWKNAYTASNPAEYWAEICQSYFDCNRVNNWNHSSIGTREQLKNYDPASYELVRTTFNLSPTQDWRYHWLQTLPRVDPPPMKFKVEPYYTKFTWAREFHVIGKGASDEALLAANDTIRKVFAYRHDILKALINDGVRLVVLGPDEKLADLPEFAGADPKSIDLNARTFDLTPEIKRIVVSQENVLADPRDRWVGDNQVVRGMARAFYRETAFRPVDPNWEKRGRDVQQYELRVKRLDVQFDERLKTLFEAAKAKDLWKGTPAAENREEYWVTGVTAYFDATGQSGVPLAGSHVIGNREQLKAFDPDLYALVNETMAYDGHVDWRYRR